MEGPVVESAAENRVGYIGRIPVRNLWLLMLYASDLFRLKAPGNVAVEAPPDDIPDLVAEILAHHVERRLRQNLTYGYRPRGMALSRVRGRIDLLTTERHQLMSRGRVFCRFEDLAVDTPRNRYVRSALEAASAVVRKAGLSRRCWNLAASLRLLGVVGPMPSRQEMSTDRFGRHDSGDQQMVSAARLVFYLSLPTEDPGLGRLGTPNREETWVRQLFEKAVGGFYDVRLSRQGWRVDRGRPFHWQVDSQTPGIDDILPSMRTDIVLEHPQAGRRVVIDTKFTAILTTGRFRENSLRSGYLYQIYAYLLSQVKDGDPLSEHAEGLLLHPSLGQMVDERAVIQGHPIRFATVDLSGSPHEIGEQLIRVLDLPNPPL